MSRARAVLLVAAAALAVPGAAAAKTITVTERSDGRRVVLNVHDKLVVKLTECAPCGYSWRRRANPKPTILKLVGNTYLSPPGPAIGGPGKRVMTYAAKGAGRTAFRLAYVSPGGSTDDTFTLRVTVR